MKGQLLFRNWNWRFACPNPFTLTLQTWCRDSAQSNSSESGIGRFSRELRLVFRSVITKGQPAGKEESLKTCMNRFSSKHQLYYLSLHSCSPVLSSHRQHKQLSRRPMEAIPTSPLRRGTTPFRLSPWALGTQQLVRFRCLASPPVTSTPLLARDRLISTSGIQIQPPALPRFYLTPRAHKTQLSEQPRLNLTIPAVTTRPMVHSHSLATSLATTTPRWV